MVDASAAQVADPLGLYTVYEPPKGCEAVLDVVFVHGLEGSSHSGWTPDGTAESFDLLGWVSLQELPSWFPQNRWPNSVRLLTYGYAKFTPGQQGLRIMTLGRDLLDCLYQHIKHSDSGRSLMLVCSGLGGWIAKAALYDPVHGGLTLEDRERCEKLRSKLASIVFRSTPSHPVDPEENISELLGSHMWLTVSSAAQKELQEKARFSVARINRDFQQCEPSFQIFSIIPTSNWELVYDGGTTQ